MRTICSKFNRRNISRDIYLLRFLNREKEILNNKIHLK